MDIGSKIKAGIKKFSSVLGLEIEFSMKKKDKDIYFINRKTLSTYLDNDETLKLYYDALKLVKQEYTDSFSKQCRFFSMQELAEYVLNMGVEGDFAECGCWKGHSTYIISTILKRHGFNGSFHVFDSFEGGLSDKTVEDENKSKKMSQEDIRREKELFASDENEVKQTLSEFDFVSLYKGWIPDRFNEVENKTFSFVHLDVDLYAPIYDSLEFFYPRLQKGGVIVFDDYGLAQFPGAQKAADKYFSSNEHALFYQVPSGGAFVIK